MAGKQMGQKHERSQQQSDQKHDPSRQKQQSQGNFGQDEAREQRDKESDLSHMGEMSRHSGNEDKSD